MSRRSGPDSHLEPVRRVFQTLPGVEEGFSYGTPGWRVKGKFLARLREDGVTLAVKCGHDERDFRMKADPEVFFTTDHYRGYPTVLVDLARVKRRDLTEVLVQTWRRQAPRRLVAEYDASL
ncbi:MAG: MmcQ/YjbR family DNA-binding protein [Gemmatimonadales bacterium]